MHNIFCSCLHSPAPPDFKVFTLTLCVSTWLHVHGLTFRYNFKHQQVEMENRVGIPVCVRDFLTVGVGLYRESLVQTVSRAQICVSVFFFFC